MIPAETAAKVAKLIPLLASDQDGETLGAARAIVRTLTAAGLDLHALADALTQTTATSADGLDWNAVWTAAREKAERAPPPEPARDPEAPESPSRRWGLPIWGVKKIEPWNVVAGHCLQLDWTIPKASGGKFLTKDERERLRKIERTYAKITDADADWIESVVARCHKARDRWRASARQAAA